MKNRVTRSLRRFWRGLTGQMRTALVLLCTVALVLVGFGVYLLVRPDTGAGEGVDALFPTVDRAGISSILIHTESGTEYTIKSRKDTVTGENGDPVTTKSFYLVTGDGVERQTLTINSMQLANLIVGTGSNYVYEAVVSRPVGEDPEAIAAYEAKLRELGFSESSPYYVLTAESGEVYRVNYGMKNITGEGYYVILEGTDTVYASKTAFIGDLLKEDGPESLIDPTLFFPSYNSYAYAFQNDFTVRDYVRVTEKGTVVTEDVYGVGYTLLSADGRFLSGSYALGAVEGESESTRVYREAIRAFLVGKSVGECNEKLTITLPDTEEMGEERGKSYELQFVSIDYVTEETLRFSVKYLQEDERDLSHKYSVYGYTAPSDITNYIPSFDLTLSMMQNTMELTGTVVKLGVSEDVLTEYGLYRHRISLSYPYNDITNLDTYITSMIYVSDVTENGTRYVAEPVLYDIVIEVDASLLEFLDKSPLELVDDYVFPTAAEDVAALQMFWNYGEGKWTNSSYTFDITHGTETNVSGESYVTITDVKANPIGGGEAIAIDPDSFTMLYSRFTYTRYRGEHGLSDEELNALIASAEDTCVLRIVMSLSDGVANFLEFYPISADRVAVRVKIGTYGETSCRFVIYRTALDDIMRAYERMMEGKDFDFEDRYE